jgi:hypothetical protein
MNEDYDDRIDLQDVMLKYAAGIDEQHDALLRSCLADDLEAPGFLEHTIRGIDDWIAYVRKELQPFWRTQHMLAPTLATVDGDHAQTRTDLQAMQVRKAPRGEVLMIWGTYHTGMVRRRGRWLIQHHELAVKKTATL